MPGPLPDPRRRRVNAPTIPTTALPASGRQGSAPRVPSWVKLGSAGKAWWRWAWSTPQACGWASGHEVAVARRASLEDELLVADPGAPKRAVEREMRELEDRFGLTPKGMAALRWEIVPDPVAEDAGDVDAVDEVAQRRAERRKLVG